MKAMHNLRLFQCNWSDLIPFYHLDDPDAKAVRIEILSSIYSKKLKAMVVTLVPEQFDSYSQGRVNQRN